MFDQSYCTNMALWLRADLRKGFDAFFAMPEGKMDPLCAVDAAIAVVSGPRHSCGRTER